MKSILVLLCVLSSLNVLGQDKNTIGLFQKFNEITETKKVKIETLLPRNGRIWSLDWSPNNKYIAIGNRTGSIRVYSAQKLELITILYGIRGTVNGISWHPDCKRIAASGHEGQVMIWDIESHDKNTLIAHKGQVRNVRWSPKGHFLASTCHDGTINIWGKNYQLIKTLKIPNGGCVGIDWLNENEIGASCWDNTVRVFDLKENKDLIFANGLQATKAVLSIDWHPSGKFLTTGDYGNSSDSINNVRFWSPKGSLLKQMTSHTKEIRALSWNPQGTLLATGGETVRLWDKNGVQINVFTINTSPVWSLDWNFQGDKIVSGHNDGKVRIWNTEGKLISIIDGHSSDITSRSFSKDSTSLVLGFSDGAIRFYDLKEMLSQTYKLHSRSITAIVWDDSGKYVAFSSNDGSGSVWKKEKKGLANIALLKEDKKGNSKYAIVWSPNYKKIAMAGYGKRIFIWKRNGKQSGFVNTKFNSIKRLEWDSEFPKAFNNNEEEQFGDYVSFSLKGEEVALVPLNKNRFAIFNKRGELIKGDKEDFVKIYREEDQKILIDKL